MLCFCDDLRRVVEGPRECIVHYADTGSSTQNLPALAPGADLPARREIWLLFPLPRRRNRLFERRGYISIFGHHVRGLRHVRLASQPCAYRFAVGYGKSSFTTHRHPFTGPAMRRRDGNTEEARDLRPALEGTGSSGRFLVRRLLLAGLGLTGFL